MAFFYWAKQAIETRPCLAIGFSNTWGKTVLRFCQADRFLGKGRSYWPQKYGVLHRFTLANAMSPDINTRKNH